MKHFYLSVQALSPLAIRSDHAEGGTKTALYIPGTTVRGSFAAAHQLLRPEHKDEFAALFLEQKVYFPHLYPALFNESPSKIHELNLPVFPLPRTAQSCKRSPGFIPLPGEKDEKRHGIRDSLLDWGTFSLLDREEQPISVLLAPFSDNRAFCQKCDQLMDHEHGYYRCGRSNPRDRMKANVSTRLQTRTGVNRNWGIVEESILYNREVFDSDMQFWGEVILPDELASPFTNFIAEADEEDIICMGTGRTRGLGKVRVVEIKEANSRNLTAFKNKLIRFDAAMRKQAQEAKVRNLAPFFFAITLHSPSILCDPFMRYYSTIEEFTLSDLLKHPTATFQRIYHSAGIRRVCGWNELWGTPRANDYAIETGSTFLFACSQELDDPLIQALSTLEEEGIGNRRSEGFGRICISDPFHLEGEQI